MMIDGIAARPNGYQAPQNASATVRATSGAGTSSRLDGYKGTKRTGPIRELVAVSQAFAIGSIALTIAGFLSTAAGAFVPMHPGVKGGLLALGRGYSYAAIALDALSLGAECIAYDWDSVCTRKTAFTAGMTAVSATLPELVAPVLGLTIAVPALFIRRPKQ